MSADLLPENRPREEHESALLLPFDLLPHPTKVAFLFPRRMGLNQLPALGYES